jgi:hypothetical protein
MIAIHIINGGFADILEVNRSWMTNGKHKKATKRYTYDSGELHKGKMSIDSGNGKIAHFTDGELIGTETDDVCEIVKNVEYVSFN